MINNTLDNPIYSQMTGFAPISDIFSSVKQAKNLVLDDVSNSLHLTIKQILAFEHNGLAVLPLLMIPHGFIRNDARFLELDTETVLSGYFTRTPNVTSSTTSIKTPMYAMISNNHKAYTLFKYMWFVGIDFLGLVAYLIYAKYLQMLVKPSAKMVDTTKSEEVGAPLTIRDNQNKADVIDGNNAKQGLPNARSITIPKADALDNSHKINGITVEARTPSTLKSTQVDFQTLKLKTAQKVQLSPKTTSMYQVSAYGFYWNRQ